MKSSRFSSLKIFLSTFVALLFVLAACEEETKNPIRPGNTEEPLHFVHRDGSEAKSYTFGDPVRVSARVPSPVGRLRARGGQGALTYSLIQSRDNFFFLSRRGLFRLRSTIEESHEKVQTFTAEVTDEAGERVSIPVTVHFNESGPVPVFVLAYINSSFSIPERSEPLTQVIPSPAIATFFEEGRHVASHGGGSMLRYEFFEDDPGPFEIDEKGHIRLSAGGTVDFEIRSQYELLVRVIDEMNNSDADILEITVTDIPGIERISPAVPVSEIASIRDDLTVNYRFVNGYLPVRNPTITSEASPFSVMNRNVTEIIFQIQNPLDYEVIREYLLKLKFTDEKGNIERSDAMIVVEDVAPVFAGSDESIDCLENDKVGRMTEKELTLLRLDPSGDRNSVNYSFIVEGKRRDTAGEFSVTSAGAVNRTGILDADNGGPVNIILTLEAWGWNSPLIHRKTISVNVIDLIQEGTEEEPFEIDTVEELQSIRGGFFNDYLRGPSLLGGEFRLDKEESHLRHYLLTADIDASGTREWNDGSGFNPIGGPITKSRDSQPDFQGILDGKGHRITGLHIKRKARGIGLIGSLSSSRGEGGIVRNIVLVDVDIRDADSLTGSLVAGLHENGTVSNCHLETTTSQKNKIWGDGGIIGGLVGSIRDSGGLIKNCSVKNTQVDGGFKSGGGGLVGILLAGKVEDCYVEKVHILGAAGQGGLVGVNGGIIENCYAKEAVIDVDPLETRKQGMPDPFFRAAFGGGLVGKNTGFIRNSYASGRLRVLYFINNQPNEDVNGVAGGLVAHNENTGLISNCYSTMAVEGDATPRAESYVGGLVGWNEGVVSSCYSTGSVANFRGMTVLGGFIGNNTGSVTKSYWDTSISKIVSPGIGVGTLSSGVMASPDIKTLTGAASMWDIILIWDLGTTTQLPVLRLVPGGVNGQRN